MAVPTLTANSPTTGSIAWTSFNVQYAGASYAVAAGNTANKYVAWLYNGGASVIATSNVSPTNGQNDATAADWAGAAPFIGPDDLLLFVNKNGIPINIQTTNMVDGDLIVNGTIVSSNLYSGTIQGNLIQAINIATDTITANEIQADAIGTSELAAGAVLAGNVAANAITAEKLTIGTVGDNLVKNPNFEDANALGTGPANWSQGQVSGAPPMLWATKIDGSKSIGVGPNTSGIGGSWQSTPFPVSPGTTLAVNGLLQATATTGGAAYVRMYYGTSSSMTFNTNLIAGTPAVPTKVNVTDLTTSTVTALAGVSGAGGLATLVNSWAPTSTNIWRFQGQTVVPAGATWAILTLYNWANATGGCTVYYDDVAVNAVLITAQIGDGVITANQIAANTINTGQLNASAINGMTITSNTINSATISSSTINTATLNSATINSGTINGTNIYGNNFRSSTTTGAAQWLQISTTNTGQSPSIDWGGVTGSGDVHAQIAETYSAGIPTFWIYGTQHSGLTPRPTIKMDAGEFITIDGPAGGSLTSTMAFTCNQGINVIGDATISGTVNVDTITANTSGGAGTIDFWGATFNYHTATHACSIITQASMPGFGSAGQDNFLSCRAASNTLGSTNFVNTVWGGFLAKTGGYGTVSTVHSKADVEPLQGALDLVRQAPAYKFKSIHGDFDGLVDRHPDHPDFSVLSNSEDWHFGPMYEDLHDHVRDSDQPTVNLGDLIGVLWGAVQELSDKMEALQTK